MEKYHVKEAFTAGFLGGLLLIFLQMVMLPWISNMDAWEFPSVMAFSVLNPTAPDIAVILVGMIVPVILTILLALTMGWVPSTWHPWAMIPVGLTFGTIVFMIYFVYYLSFHRQMADIFNLWHYFAFVTYGIFIAVAYHKMVRKNYKPDNPLYRGYANE